MINNRNIYYICPITKTITMSLYLPQTKNLKQLAEYLNVTPESLIEKIETGFAKQEEELCDQEDAGRPIGDILADMDIKVSVFACFYLKRSDKYINEVLSNIYFKNTLDDCPTCGCETSTEWDWNEKGRGTESKICSNCGDVDTEVTDWHKLERGADY